jgi:hypothetical protein
MLTMPVSNRSILIVVKSTRPVSRRSELLNGTSEFIYQTSMKRGIYRQGVMTALHLNV